MADNKSLDMLLQGLDQQGTLSKVRAQIKASVFKIIDQAQGKKSGVSQFFWENTKGKELHSNPDYLILLEVIKEFLQFFDFDYTLSVLNSEANHKEYIKRDVLSAKLGFAKTDIDSSQPILSHIYSKFSPKNAKAAPAAKAQAVSSKSLEKSKPEPVKAGTVPSTNAAKTQANKFESAKPSSDFQFEEIEEDLEDEIQGYQPQKLTAKNPSTNFMLTSSEEQLASMSQGLDITVESSEIHQYDYVEDIRQKK